MVARQAVGIEVGATRLTAAWVNDAGRSEMIGDQDGNQYFPATVLFDDARYYVGEEANLRCAGKADRLARSVKHSLGKPFHERSIRCERLPPEVIQACMFHKVREELDRRLGKGYGVVLTVPAFFGELKRKAIADAGEIAGLQILDILNESTAAALAFGERTGYLTSAGASLRRLRALVFNLNAATFEITLLEISPGGVATLAVDGDLTLGGQNWNDRLANCAAEQFIRRHGMDPRDDPAMLEQLLSRTERAKLLLGVRPSTHFQLRFAGKLLDVKVTREEFVAATVDLVDRTAEIVERLLATAGFAPPLVDRVFLTGGATQTPAIRAKLHELFGREPDSAVHPCEAVARGAALYARCLLRTSAGAGQMPHFELNDISTRSLGIQGVDSRGKVINKVLIPRGARLPAAATEKFLIHPKRNKEVVITVLEGESRDARECEVVGKAIIRNLPQDLGQEWPVAVTYQVTASGRLHVDAHLCYTDRAVHLEVMHGSNLSRVQRDRWKEIVAAEAGWPAFRAELHRNRKTPVVYAATDAPADAAEEPLPESEPLLSRTKHWLHRQIAERFA